MLHLITDDQLHLTIVIVNWNSGTQLEQCIDSIRHSDGGDDIQIIVVDNDSHDGSADSVRELHGVKVVDANENLGFAKACNLGALLASTPFLLFLNPDTLVFGRTLATAVRFMERPENNTVGICGVQLLDEKNEVSRSCAHFPTPSRLLAQSFGLDRIFPRYSHFMSGWKHDRNALVDQVIGAFFLVRRELFDLLDGFDTRFFVYFEEIDFSLRAHKAGWLSAYIAETQAFHSGGGCSRQVKAKRLFYSIRSRLLYCYKHFSRWSAFAVTAATILVEPVARIAFALMRGSIPAVGHTAAGYAMLCRWMVQQRKDGTRQS